MLSKKDLVEKIYEARKKEFSLLSKQEILDVLDNAFEIIGEELSKGEKIKLSSFGTFEVRERVPHKVKVPGQDKYVVVPSQKSVLYRASKQIKDRL